MVSPAGSPDVATLTFPKGQLPLGEMNALTLCAPPPAVRLTEEGKTLEAKSGLFTTTVNVMLLLIPAVESLMFSTAVFIPGVAPLADTLNATV